jgi:L-seryl-tRNA(Ser) seleniumtransferase
VLALQPARISIDEFASRLRRTPTPLVGRAQEGRLLLDLRTVAPSEEGELLKAILAALTEDAR